VTSDLETILRAGETARYFNCCCRRGQHDDVQLTVTRIFTQLFRKVPAP